MTQNPHICASWSDAGYVQVEFCAYYLKKFLKILKIFLANILPSQRVFHFLILNIMS